MGISFTKILAILGTVSGYAVYILLAISMFSISSSLTGSLTPEQGGESMRVEFEPDGDAIFSLNVKNGGLLSGTHSMNIQVMTEGVVVREGKDSLELPAGGVGVLNVKLKLTKEQMEDIASAKSKIFFTFESRALNGLAGMGARTELVMG